MKMNRNGYFFDVNTKTLYMTKAFERKALQYGSEEFKLVSSDVQIPCRTQRCRVRFETVPNFV